MSGQLASACWTCRIRRKKCDRTKPHCASCRALEITCYYDDKRPEWMDGGLKQAEMAQRIKAEVRQGAEARRERQYIQVLTLHEDRNSRYDVPAVPQIPQHHQRSLSSANNSSTDPDDRSDSGMEAMSMSITPKSSPAPPSDRSLPVCPDCLADGFTPPPMPKDQHQYGFTIWNMFGIDNERDRAIANDVETDMTMAYVDWVFPFLFPFYQPPVWEGGRSWLLAMLRDNTALFHSAMSLSAYFFTLVMKGGERHKVCAQHIWNKLVGHVDTAVRSMQQDMEHLKTGGDAANSAFHKARVMESIIQLLILEHSMARTADWNVHLSAALALFTEIFETHGTGRDGQPDIVLVIDALERPHWSRGLAERVVWNTDQGAFRFFAAVLLYTDIVASTSLEKPPRLRHYHHLIVQSDHTQTPGAPKPPDELLRMENFVGCHGWALVTVGEIATLDAWKKETKLNGTFCINELIAQGHRLHQKLQEGLANLERESFKKRPYDIMNTLRSYYRPDAAHQAKADEQISATRIWALAATAYLSVVVTGWHAAVRTTTSSIAVAMQLMYGISSPAVVRSLSWPFYVLGCLATKEQEQMFVYMASSMADLREFGTVGEALRIMQRVWELRDANELHPETWDLASCYGVLGTRTMMT